MQNLLLLSFLLLSFHVSVGQADTSLVKFQSHSFFLIQATENSRLIIFLHGGLSNPQLEAQLQNPDLHFLLEGNTEFVQSCLSQGFNVLVPLKEDSLHWLSHPGYCHKILIDYLQEPGTGYSQVFLSGFSDGGTGSFKIFYDHPADFDGLIVFNGYPQHANFHKSVDYSKITDQKIVFFATFQDPVIPYEFSLIAYCDQKKYNPCTYLYLTEGKHLFSEFHTADFDNLFDILLNRNVNVKNEVLHGFVRNDVMEVFYPFRKKILQRYGFRKEVYEMNKTQMKLYQHE